MAEKDKPFITGQSPGIMRARDEYKHPSPAPDPEMIAALSRIVEREHAAAAAFRVGLERVAPAGRLTGSGETHEFRAAAVSDLISRLGGAAPAADEADPRSIPVSADEIQYLDKADEITGALDRDEQAVQDAYESALRSELPDDVARELRAIRRMTPEG